MAADLKSLDKLIRSFVAQATREMKAILKKNGKGNSNLINILQYMRVSRKGDMFSIKSNLPDYAKFIQTGRKPGKQPSMEVIVAWCKRKRIETKYAFPIAQKIGKEGIKPINFMAPILDLNELVKLAKAEYKNIVLAEIKKEILLNQTTK